MFYILIVLISAATFLLQTTILPQAAVLHVSLNFIVLTSIFFLIFLDKNFAVTFSLVLGFLLDIFSAGFFGSTAISLVLVVVVLKHIIDLYFQKENFASTIFLQVIGVILFDVFYALINIVAAQFGLPHATFTLKTFLINIVPLSAIWASVASLILLRFFKKLTKIVQYFQVRSRS